MIIVSADKYGKGLTPTVGPLPEPERSPSFFPSVGAFGRIDLGVLGSAFGIDSAPAAALDIINRPTFKPDPDFDPYPFIKDTIFEQEHLDDFVGVQSEAEMRSVMSRIERNNKLRETVARGGALGVLASVAAGVADPTMLVPVAGLIRLAATTGRAARTSVRAAEAAALAGGTVAAQQGVLAAADETHTMTESLFAISAAAILGGALGAGSGLLTPVEREALEESIRLYPSEVDNLGKSIGAAAVERGSGKMANALGAERLPIINRQDPVIRSMNSIFPEQRDLVRDIAELPTMIEANAKGIPTTVGGSVQYLAKSHDSALGTSLESLDAAYSKYFFGAGVRFAKARATLAAVGGRTSGKMTFAEFKRAVTDAMYSGDKSPIPEVAEAARAFRANVEEPLKNAAIEIRLFTPDVKPGDDVSHIYRMWDPDLVAPRRAELAEILARDFADQIDSLKMQITRMVREGEEVLPQLHEAAAQTPQEIKALAEDSVNTILGFSPDRGMMPWDITPGPRGPLKERMLRIKTEKVKDFIVRDVAAIQRAMVKTMAADIALMKKFGTLDPDQISARINDRAAKMAEEAIGNKKRQAQITAAQKQARDDTRTMVERIRGIYGVPKDPRSIAFRALNTLRNYNVVTKLGNVVASSISDVGKVISNYGLNNALRTAFHPLVNNLRTFKVAAKEAKIWNAALDRVLHSRQMALNDISDSLGRGSKVERGVQWLTDKFGTVSLMDFWNTGLKQFTGIVAQTKMLQGVERVINGKATTKEIEYLASMNIDANAAERIWKQFSDPAKGMRDGPVWAANTETWTDHHAAEMFGQALHREINRTIVTPGLDLPNWMAGGSPVMGQFGRIIGQFHTFNVASVQRTLLTGLQQRDLAALNGAIAMLSLGALSWYLKSTLAGRDVSKESYAVWAVEAFSASGLAGWLFDANAVLEKASQGNIGISALTGKQISKYQQMDLFSLVAGSSSSSIRDVINVVAAATSGDVLQSDVRSLRRMIPFQNAHILRLGFDAIEEAVNETFGIPEKKGQGASARSMIR